jgi:acyl carrier protein
MADTPTRSPRPALARFPAEILGAYERHRTTGDAGALRELIMAAVVDYRPSGAGGEPHVTDRTRLFEDLAYDSVAVAELIFFFEDLFDVTISNEDIMGVRTVGDLRDCVAKKLAGLAPK